MGSLANTEDPDEMQLNAAFHQGHTIAKIKAMFYNIIIGNSDPLRYIYWWFHAYCISIKVEVQ